MNAKEAEICIFSGRMELMSIMAGFSLAKGKREKVFNYPAFIFVKF